MVNKIKNMFYLILVAVAIAMGIAVIVFTVIKTEIDIIGSIRMLGIGVAALGLWALHINSKNQG